jgi:hypothetical protein
MQSTDSTHETRRTYIHHGTGSVRSGLQKTHSTFCMPKLYAPSRFVLGNTNRLGAYNLGIQKVECVFCNPDLTADSISYKPITITPVHKFVFIKSHFFISKMTKNDPSAVILQLFGAHKTEAKAYFFSTIQQPHQGPLQTLQP